MKWTMGFEKLKQTEKLHILSVSVWLICEWTLNLQLIIWERMQIIYLKNIYIIFSIPKGLLALLNYI